MMARFTDIFSDETKRGYKIQTSEYLPAGKYPIIDQGQAQIVGYTNLEDGLFTDVPAIVFGDHTRIIKYIDAPFFLGADGVKVLKVKANDADYKYLFYCLQNARIPNTGYNRHYKWLKEVDIPFPNLDEQRKIAAVLDKVSDLMAKRRQQLNKLDELVKSRFVEMFGAVSADKCTKRIKDYAEVLGGYAFKSDLFCSDSVPVIRISNINNGRVELDYSICFDKLFWEQNKRFRVERNDILMAMSGATTGKAGIYKDNSPALINQRVACIRAKNGIALPQFLFVATQLEWMYDLIQKTSAGCAQPNISGKQIENMPMPNATYEQQQQFTAFVVQVNKSKVVVQKALDEAQLLFDSLMQEYFG